MEKIEATFRVVTPMFISGAEQEKAELRVPSIKGALRFWWRALAWSRYGDLKKIREEEDRLFGSTNTGQSMFLAKVKEDDVSSLSTGKQVSGGIAYLGYGIAEYKRERRRVETIRDAIAPGSQFLLQISFKKGAEVHRDELLNTLWCLTNLGGMGSRSRRGFGSMVVTEVEGGKYPSIPRSANELKEQIEQKLREFRIHELHKLPEYTALSGHTTVMIWPLHTRSWEQALEKVGSRLNAYRSSRQERNFLDDRNLIRDYAYGRAHPSYAPRRTIFGLPHNYFFVDTKTNIPISGPSRERDRRASPLFMHLHQLENKELVAVLSLIPASFLPKGSKAKVGPAVQNKRRIADEVLVRPPNDFSPIKEFLSSLSQETLEVQV
ncbi:MAG: type III-B CRISPR module RAMP protein Cmr1 [Actinomycetota bacterium]